MAKPVNVEIAEADGFNVLGLAKDIAEVIGKADPSPADALAALLLVCYIIGRRGWPVVDENVRPFVKDVSTYMSTYELPVTAEAAKEAYKTGAPLPTVPDAPAVN